MASTMSPPSPASSRFPNPASAITCIPVELSRAAQGRIALRDAAGREVAVLFGASFRQAAAGTSSTPRPLWPAPMC